ncbi:hypothetical protein Cfla_3510 [Cellulomonas flavigena DSM 20109]|uniref:Uncharacterized protein n=1 Tax=Cellulomonas flavigena (strain ATCC 482 / DSM 20109 / BCRC 11376 / JCM 18109 / NBRC 3775 / NCIMB 8073 / NRS 134) TaxID=446466 RepID=D5UDC6_CELFN|nr:hypothetical protein Cfla_3510 [Cellulomonas flavigena DSM 20109]
MTPHTPGDSQDRQVVTTTSDETEDDMARNLVPTGGRGRSTAAWIDRLLSRPADGAEHQHPTPAAAAALITAVSTAHRTSGRAQRALLRASSRLVQAGSRVRDRQDALDALDARRADDAPATRTRSMARGRYLHPATAAAIEVVVLLAEIGFWYMLGSETLASSASLLERLPAMLLAAFIPMSGLSAAHVAGRLVGRALHGEVLDTGRRVMLVGSLVILAVLCGVTFWLVSWRYEESQIGARELPGAAMGLLFALLLPLIAYLHAVCVDHERHEAAKQASERLRLLRALSRAGADLVTAGLRLAGIIDRVLDEIERVLLTAQAMVVAADAGRGVTSTVAFAERTAEARATLAHPWTLKVVGPSLPLHDVARAIDLLTAYAPDERTAARVTAVQERLARVFDPSADAPWSADAAPAAPAGATADPRTGYAGTAAGVPQLAVVPSASHDEPAETERA